jgi:hypothetical protein
LHIEIYKTWSREFFKDPRQYKDIIYSWVGTFNSMKILLNTFKTDQDIQYNLFQNVNCLLARNANILSNTHVEMQRALKNKNNYEKEQHLMTYMCPFQNS